NRYACCNSQEGLRFTTAFIAEYEVSSRKLTYINAGHNVPVLRRSSNVIERLTCGGVPLGIQAEASYETGTVTLESGDWLTIFTDGLVEAENSLTEEYGEQRLLNVLAANANGNAEDMLRAIMRDLDAYVALTPQHDDITCLIINVTHSG